MTNDVRLSVRGLSKAFPRRDRQLVKGVATDGPAALGYLIRQTLWPTRKRETPDPDGDEFVRALQDVSFDVRAGEVLGIIGRNGAGKTTLLKILARVLDPSAGRVVIRGRVVSMLDLGIGLAPDLTVRENIQIQGRLAGIRGRRIDEAESGILEFAGLTEYRDVPLGACPSGSAVQLGFAAMVTLSADVILADEVLAVGDSTFRRACEERVRAAGQSGESVLFVSHDMNAIRRICTRVIWIDRARIVQAGATQDVVRAYTSELLAGNLLPPITGEGLAASCALLDLRLLDADRAQVGALQLTEPGYVDCLFRISRPDVAVTIEIELWQGKHHILTATSTRAIMAKETTAFRAGMRIPADFLNEVEYQVRCRLRVASIADPGLGSVVAADAWLDVAVMNPHPRDSVWKDWPWGRAGLVSPRLSWTRHVEPLGPAGSHGCSAEEALIT